MHTWLVSVLLLRGSLRGGGGGLRSNRLLSRYFVRNMTFGEGWKEWLTSSGYRSSSDVRGMCSVRAKVCMPLEIAVWITSSKVSFAWPGQNCPE